MSTGEIEVLGTSLLEEEKYPMEDFKEICNKRWGIETYFKKIKTIYEVERFSGKILHTILQDFYGIIFLSNIESMISRETEEELNEENKDIKPKYKVNH